MYPLLSLLMKWSTTSLEHRDQLLQIAFVEDAVMEPKSRDVSGSRNWEWPSGYRANKEMGILVLKFQGTEFC